jgi:hypothetical protein
LLFTLTTECGSGSEIVLREYGRNRRLSRQTIQFYVRKFNTFGTIEHHMQSCHDDICPRQSSEIEENKDVLGKMAQNAQK